MLLVFKIVESLPCIFKKTLKKKLKQRGADVFAVSISSIKILNNNSLLLHDSWLTNVTSLSNWHKVAWTCQGANSEPIQTFKMASCTKIVNSLKPLIQFAKSPIPFVWQGSECTLRVIFVYCNKNPNAILYVCSEIHFSKIQLHIESSQSISTVYQFTGFYATQALTERCFLTDINSSLFFKLKSRIN